MIKLTIVTENIGGDEELVEALRAIADQVEEGVVEGELPIGGDRLIWAVNPYPDELPEED